MDFLKMTAGIEGNRIMLEYNGEEYTYEKIINMAQTASKSFPDKKEGKIRVVKKKKITDQLVDFFACFFCGCIPMVTPYDSNHYENGQYIDLPETAGEIKDSPCVAVLTSGTTGEPKIYLRTYESWAGYFDIQNKIFKIDADTKLFCHGGLAFTGNMNLYLSVFFIGAEIIASDRTEPDVWKEGISRANMIYMIPSKLMFFEKWCGKGLYPDIRMILSGSQGLGRCEADRLKRIFPNTEVLLYYGASELNYITYVTDRDMTDEKNLIGRPFPDVRVWIENNEIYVDTKYHVMGIECPYTLSDTGYMDGEGRFYFTGRSDDIMNIRGRKVSAVNIENELLKSDMVAEAAVMPDEEGNIIAFIVSGTDKDPDIFEIRKALSAGNRLASYERPKKIIPVSSLPKTDSGKVDKRKLIVSR